MIRKLVDREAEGVLVVHVKDFSVSTHRQAAMEQFISDTRNHFATKCFGKASY